MENMFFNNRSINHFNQKKQDELCSLMIPPLFGKQEVGIWRVQKRFPQYGIPIWRLWSNIRFLPSTVTEKNILDGQRYKSIPPSPFGERGYNQCYRIWLIFPLPIINPFNGQFRNEKTMNPKAVRNDGGERTSSHEAVSLTSVKELTKIVVPTKTTSDTKSWSKMVSFMVFNATFNNISAISWRSVLLMEETGVPWENHRPVTSHWQTLSHNEVKCISSTCNHQIWRKKYMQ
jgi:hypothetical protein